MTVPEALDEIALRINDPPPGKRVPRTWLARILSRAQEQVARRTFALRVLHEITTEEGRSAWPLPSRFLREYSVLAIDQNGGTQRIRPMHRLHAHGARPTDIPTDLFYYLERGRTGEPNHNIVIWPSYPRDGDSIEVWCAVVPPRLNVSASVLSMPEETHDAVLWLAIARASELPQAMVDDRIRQRWRLEAEQAMRQAIASTSRSVGSQQAVIVPLV